MILELYSNLERIALEKFPDIIAESLMIHSFSGRVRKMRFRLIDNSFVDIWYSSDGDYSYHWEQRDIRNKIYRHDNAPHKKWRHINTFPKHCHDGNQDNVIESHISDNAEDAIVEFFSIVRQKLFESTRSS